MLENKVLDVNKKNEEIRKAGIKAELVKISDKITNKRLIVSSYINQKNTAEAFKVLDEIDELTDLFNEKAKEIGVPMDFEGMSASNTNHGLTADNGSNESLESRVFIVNTKSYKGVFEDRNYYITTEKQKTASEDPEILDLVDYIESHEYDLTEKTGALQSIHGVDSDYRDDDPGTFDRLSHEVENECYTNSVNKLILGVLSTEKNLVAVDPKAINTSVHEKLCAKAKKNTIIVTNNTGMKKLDVTDENGVSLIKRVNGKIIYKDSFEVVEIDNDFLPDITNGSPCFIGDIFGACALIKYREKRELQSDGVEAFETYAYRYTDYVKAIQRTASDKAYIAGYFA